MASVVEEEECDGQMQVSLKEIVKILLSALTTAWSIGYVDILWFKCD